MGLLNTILFVGYILNIICWSAGLFCLLLNSCLLWAAASVNVFHQQLRQGEAVLGLAAQACRLLRLYRLNAAKLIFDFSKTTKLTDFYTILGFEFNPIWSGVVHGYNGGNFIEKLPHFTLFFGNFGSLLHSAYCRHAETWTHYLYHGYLYLPKQIKNGLVINE